MTLADAGLAHARDERIVRRIKPVHHAHRRPVPSHRAAPCEPEVRTVTRIVRESAAPHALLHVGGWLVALAAGVMLGIGLSNYWG